MTGPSPSLAPTRVARADPEALSLDQRARWQRGEPLRVADYLGRYPDLQTDPELLLDLIYREVVLREEAGESPRLDDYLPRFAALEGQLRPIFEVHRAIALLPSESGAITVTSPSLEPAGPPPEPALFVVPGYDVLAELGRGAMGVVYKARQHGLGRLVALKMLAPGAAGSAAHAARFRAEALLTARLHHPNIVQIYEIGTHEGQPFFALELVEGGNLAAHLGGNPQPVHDAARLLVVLARAVHAAHTRGIIHRDLKPANILLHEEDLPQRRQDAKEERKEESELALSASSSSLAPLQLCGRSSSSLVPKITDFGLAKDLSSTRGDSQTGDILGTPCYMAPEQAAGRIRDVGPAADIYALGVILYELLTGRPPFMAETWMETLREVQQREPVPPRRLRPRTPRDLETICLKCLAKEPRRRYANAAALADDLERFLDGRPIRARRVSLRERAVKWVRRRPALAALLAVAAAALVALGLIWYQAAAREARRQDLARADVTGLLRAGRNAFLHDELPEARSRAAVAVDRVRAEPALGDLLPGAEDLLAESERRLAEQAARREAAQALQAFHRHSDDALFHGMNALAGGTLLTGMDPAAHAAAAETAARLALERAGLPLPGDGEKQEARQQTGILFAPGFGAAERQEVAAGCYTLLLILTDALAARGGPAVTNRDRAALQLLAVAGKLQEPTRVYHQRRAYYLERLGETTAARSAAALAERSPADNALDYFLTGQEEYQHGDVRRALADFERAVGLQPDHFWAQCYLAVCCLRERRWSEARSALTVCVQQQPAFVWAWLLRGYANREYRAFTAAEADFRRAGQVLEQEANEEAHYVLLVNRGVLRFEEDEAARSAAAATALALPAAGGQFALSGPALLSTGAAPTALTAAAADLEQAARLRPRQYVPRLNLARVYQQQGRTADAERSFREAVRLQPPGPVLADYLTEQGRSLDARGQHKEAVAACQAALAQHGRHAPAFLVLGQALLHLGSDAEAVVAFDRYLEAGGAPTADLFRGRGLALLRRGRYAAARDDLTWVIQRQPDAGLYLQRGWAYFFLDAWKPALLDFKESVRRESGQADAHAGCGLCHAYLGEYREAIAEARQVRDCKPSRSETLLNLACLYALASAQVEEDAAEKDRSRLAAAYRDQALAALAEALDSVHVEDRPSFWRQKVVTDTALASVRKTPRFVQWREQFGPAGPRRWP
jgi:serine/threonine protein kinase/Tfp pilus assembly protein PilF